MGAERYFKLSETIRLDLLELYGSGYVIDHCISAFLEEEEKKSYCIYVTDALRAYINASGRVTLNERWADLIKPRKPIEDIEEEAAGIKNRIINGLKRG